MKRDSFALVRLLAARFFRQAQRHCYNRVRRAFRMAQLGVHTSTSLTGSIVRSWLAYHPGIRNSAVVRPRYSRRPRLLLGRARAISEDGVTRSPNISFPPGHLVSPWFYSSNVAIVSYRIDQQTVSSNVVRRTNVFSQPAFFISPFVPAAFFFLLLFPPEHGSI